MSREIKYRYWDEEVQEMICWEIILDDGFHKYLDENLMQFTGLYDKNGKEIYQDDVVILEGKTDEPWHVGWFKEDACFCIREPVSGASDGMADSDKMEVIGNLWEISELLEGRYENQTP